MADRSSLEVAKVEAAIVATASWLRLAWRWVCERRWAM